MSTKILVSNAVVRKILKLMDKEDFQLLQDELAEDPERGYVISGTGGVRGYRFALEGGGKSGGARIIYYYYDEKGQIYLFMVYPKSDKKSLTQGEKNQLKKIIQRITHEEE